VRLWIVSDSAAESPGVSRRILIVLCLILFAIGIEELIYVACIGFSSIGDVLHRDASKPVAVLRSRSATSNPSCP